MVSRRVRLLLAAAACAALLAVAGGGLAGPASDGQAGGGADRVTVAVVDSGIDDGHPALEGRVAERVDLTGAEPTHPETGVDNNGHGTFVAGVAAEAAGDRPVEFLDVRVVDEGGWTADDAAVAEGVEYAVEGGADVILLSLTGVGDDDRMEAAVARARDEGAVVVASAGNRNRTRGITTPGTAPGAITVGATDGGEPWERSARGPTLDGVFKPELVAPGVATGPRAGGGETRMRGTSVAAAAVAGVAAGVVSVAPDLRPAAVEARLASAARPLGDGSGHVVGSGSGELDADRALDPEIVTDGVVDFGVVDGSTSETITVENRGDRRHEIAFEPTLENVDTGADATDALELDRREVSLAPGESVTLELGVDLPGSGAYAGELRYSVDGTPRSVAVGAFAGGTVTVDKRALSPDGAVDGDELLVFTEGDTHTELLAFEDGTAEFLGGGGSYVLWSSGVDDPTGSLVLLSERLTVEGDTYVRLDEADTVRAGVDATALESAYGPLQNRSVTASMRTAKGAGTEHLSRSLTDAGARTVRVSRDPDTELVTTYLLAAEAGLGGADVFHLENRVGAARWATPRTVTPDELESTTYRVGRTTVDRFPEIQERATVTGGYNSRQLAWFEPTARSTQTVHHTPGIDHERRLRADGWRADLDPGGGVALSHPFVAVADVGLTDGTASIEARPLADGAGTRLHTDGEHTVTVTSGENVTERRGGDPVFEFDVEAAVGEPLSVRVEGDNPESRLSTRTLTELTVADPAGSIPTIRDLRLPGATRAGAAGPGEVTLRIDADAPTAVEAATVWYAAAEPEEPPWIDGTGWERTPAGAGYGSLRATFDVPEDAARVSLAVELETDAGNIARTATASAFHAGSAPNTSTRTIEGRLSTAAGEPADNDTVVASPVDGDSPIVAETDAAGRFELEVPKDERYDLTYRRGDLWDGDAPTPDRPDLLALGRLNATADVDREWTLPEPTRLDVTVDDARGEPVANATVRLAHRAGNATSAVELETDANGTVSLGASPAIHLGDTIELAVTPPDEPVYVGENHNRTVELGGGPATERVVVDTEPPTAALSASRTWMLHGTPTTLNATGGDVPAGAAEYRWDLDGDGTADRVTAEPTLRYEPAPGVSEPSVTVVDRAEKRASADAGPIRVDERG